MESCERQGEEEVIYNRDWNTAPTAAGCGRNEMAGEGARTGVGLSAWLDRGVRPDRYEG